MFETTEVILQMIQIYLVIGFSLGILYNVFRFFIVAFPGFRFLNAFFDILFSLIAGIVLFVFSAAYGMGYFRLYYVFAAALGFLINMLTLGFAVPPSARVFGRVTRRLYGLLRAEIGKLISFIRQKSTVVFIKISENITKINEKCKIHLKKHNTMMYNINDHRIGDYYEKGGETGNVIKAKVRKIS